MEAINQQNVSFPVVFYDGDCGFCNRSVQFILRYERADVLRFAALQSAFAQSFFRERKLPEPDMSTFYFFDGKRLHSKSRAAFHVLKYLHWYWRLLGVFRLLPPALSDKFYDFIAARRKRIAGEFCTLPSPAQRKRFLM